MTKVTVQVVEVAEEGVIQLVMPGTTGGWVGALLSPEEAAVLAAQLNVQASRFLPTGPMEAETP
jgi:hypothetical protein